MKQKLIMNTEQPEHGDYVQLIDHSTGKPCENFTYVDKWLAELGCQLFLISDYQGEDFTIARYSDFDNDFRKAWQEVITATA